MSDPALALLEEVPIGIAVFDADQRAVLVNAAYCDSMSMPPGSFPPGTTLESMLRVGAYRGLLGPGDPEAQVAAALAADRSHPQRLRRRVFDGRSFDLQSRPLPDGGHVVCAVEITPLVQARNEAERGARRIANVVSTLRSGLAAFAPDRTMLLHNARFAELIGVPLAPLARGMPFESLLDLMRGSDEYASLDGQSFIDQQRQMDRARPINQRRIRSDGRVLDIASDPLPEGGWTLSLTDISQLARAEDDSRRRAAVSASIVENIPHAISVYGPDQRVRMVNRTYKEIMADVPLEVGERFEDMVRRRVSIGEYSAEFGESLLAYRRGAREQPEFYRRVRPNGTILDVRTSRLPDGGHVVVMTDVTRQVIAETAAQRRALQIDAMLASTRHGIAMFDADKHLVASNPAVSELLGLPDGVFVRGRALIDIIKDLYAAGLFGTGETARATRDNEIARDRTVPWLVRLVTAAERVVEIQGDPTPDGGFVLSYIDSTPFIEAEQALRAAKDAAEAASQAKSRFLATMSHELRTPLNAVIGFSDALISGATSGDPERVREFARTIHEAGQKLLELVNNVLDVARLEPEQLNLSVDRIDLDQLLDTCIRQNTFAASTHDITLKRLPIDGARPGTAPPRIRILADQGRLAQAINHLVSNAIKFGRRGGMVALGAAPTKTGDLVITVEDDGIGIPEADLERVFEPFIQIDQRLERHFAGAGLGLYVSRTLIEAHDGTVRLRRRQAGGTIAEIVLPAARVEVAAPVTEGAADAAPLRTDTDDREVV